jgi:PRTRC genetic system protein E
MSFFTELYALAQHTALTLQIVADEKTGRMTINVKPKVQKDTADPALATALSLTATPEEFDAGFVQALRDYTQAHTSLAQQAAATAEVLAAAKTASQRKATQAISGAAKGSGGKGATQKPAGTASASAPDGEPDDDDADADADAEGGAQDGAGSGGGGTTSDTTLDLFN